VQERWRRGNNYTLVRGDCAKLLPRIPTRSVNLILTSPPYCIGKSYENNTKAEDFLPALEKILPDLIRILRVGGSICWQVGYHVTDNIVTPLDVLVCEMMREYSVMKLRNRVVWTFGHGLHIEDRFSGRHETLLWFTKGKRYRFELNAVRVLQKYPGKRHYKGERHGDLSGNPKGKNPSDVWESSDVWDIPNVKANHVEKTVHPCQFPITLARRIIAATTKKNALVLDPFAGAGTTGIAAASLQRRFVGAEINHKYHRLAVRRLAGALGGELIYRPDWKPVYQPKPNTPLTTIPATWKLNGSATVSSTTRERRSSKNRFSFGRRHRKSRRRARIQRSSSAYVGQKR
jgi:adenine-specific DNA-methyltransferase